MSDRSDGILQWLGMIGGVVALLLIAPFVIGALYAVLMPAGFGATCEHHDRWLPQTPLHTESYRAYLLNKGCSHAEARRRAAAVIFASQADVDRFADPDFTPRGSDDILAADALQWELNHFDGFPVDWRNRDGGWLERKIGATMTWAANNAIIGFTTSLHGTVNAFVPAYNRYPLLRTVLLLVYIVLGAGVTALAGVLIVRILGRKKAGGDPEN